MCHIIRIYLILTVIEVMVKYRWVTIWVVYLEWVNYGLWMNNILSIYKYMFSIFYFFIVY